MEKSIYLSLKIYIFILYIFIINSSDESSNKIQSPNLAIIPFKIFFIPNKNINNYFSSSKFLDIIHSSLPYLEIESGKSIKSNMDIPREIESKIKNKKQFLSIFIVIDDYTFYIDENYFYNEQKNLICRYSSQLSSSYEINNDISSKYRNSIYASDYFKVYSDLSLNNSEMIKIIFRHSLDINKNISFCCGKVGLLYNSEKQDEYKKTGFMYQIHSNLNNIDYSFMLKFNQNKNYDELSDGLFIIGIESYIKNNQNYEYFTIYTKSKSSIIRQEWRFSADKLNLGNKKILLDKEEFVIKTEIEGIEIPYDFYEIINEEFFNYYYKNNICSNEDIYNYYIIISCYSNNFTSNDINKFPKIEFSIKEIRFNFSFSEEELFYKKENKFYLKLIPKIESNQYEFKLGRMFLKKYNVIFNADSKTMTFYRFKSINNKSDKNNEYTHKKNGFLIFLSYFFIGIIFLVLGLYLGRKFCLMRRKIYANELEDNNYVYESNRNKKKKEQKLIEL